MSGSYWAARRIARHARHTRTFVATTEASMVRATCLTGRPSMTCNVKAMRWGTGMRSSAS